ncbi:Acetyltransferase (GNAT) family protein [Lachnospiraceae bacterium XBB2008]|nr:Acetyltransferase (GNAT) family protein [Lachnospiraceae bacterium XBB2008]
MEARIISPDVRDRFKKLITDGVNAALANGIPVIAIGLTEDDLPVGALAGLLEEGDIFSVMSLYVDPKYRRRGGGTLLIESLGKLLDDQNLPPAVLSYIEGEGDMDTIAPFMDALGIAEDMGGEKLYYGRLSTYLDYGFGDSYDAGIEVKKVSQLQSVEINAFKQLIHKNSTGVKGGAFTSLKPDKDLSYVISDCGVVEGFMIAGHTKKHPEDLTIRFSEGLSEDRLRAFLEELIGDLASKDDKDFGIRIPVPDDRYAGFFEEIEGVRDIQHDYLL